MLDTGTKVLHGSTPTILKVPDNVTLNSIDRSCQQKEILECHLNLPEFKMSLLEDFKNIYVRTILKYRQLFCHGDFFLSRFGCSDLSESDIDPT